MSDIAVKIAQLETLLASLKAELVPNAPKKGKKSSSDTEKPKRPPTDWIVFCGRVKDVLKANEMPITSGVRESTKFCSMLKGKKAYSEWTDEAILEARGAWVMPVTPPTTAVASDVETVVKTEEKPEAKPEAKPEKKAVKPRAKKTA